MAAYIISDIHGQYDMFSALLVQIKLKEEDKLYILGDMIDRGPEPIRTMLKIMDMPNVICIKGNHEMMALDYLEFFMQDASERIFLPVDENQLDKILLWDRNGSSATLEEFCKLSLEKQKSVAEFIRKMPVWQKVVAGNKEYLLVHGGLGGFYPEKTMEEYSVNELVWERPEYSIQYFTDIYVVTGHTPTQLIPVNPKPGYIFKGNHHIAIDCGSYRSDGRLAAIRLDDGQEFYSDYRYSSDAS